MVFVLPLLGKNKIDSDSEGSAPVPREAAHTDGTMYGEDGPGGAGTTEYKQGAVWGTTGETSATRPTATGH